MPRIRHTAKWERGYTGGWQTAAGKAKVNPLAGAHDDYRAGYEKGKADYKRYRKAVVLGGRREV